MDNRSEMTTADNWVFCNLGDKIINDPRPIIRQNRNKIDYQALQVATNIGIAELWGKRSSQEDRFSAGALSASNFEHLKADQYNLVLTETVAMLQKHIEYLDIHYFGSTLCAALLIQDHIHVANLGDSLAYICIMDANNEIIKFGRLNTVLHNPATPSEKIRLTELDCAITDDRIGDYYSGEMLAVSRSLGDEKFKNYGLSHIPDYYHYQAEIPTGGKGFIICACDGLTERECLTDELMIDILKQHHNLPVHQLAKKLAGEAYKNGSKDNISVLVTPITQKLEMKYLAIFDGHSGAYVAEALGQLFASILQLKLQIASLKNILQAMPAEAEVKKPLTQLHETALAMLKDLPAILPILIKHDKTQYILPMTSCYENAEILKNTYTHYAQLLEVVLCNLDPNVLQQAVIFSNLLNSFNQFKSLQQQYCPQMHARFLHYPIGIFKKFFSQMSVQKTIDHTALTAEFAHYKQDMEILYQAAQHIFSVRTNYKPSMQESYAYDWEYDCKDDKTRKNLIFGIEEAIQKAFISYPHHPIKEVLNDLSQDLTSQQMKFITRPHSPGLFADANRDDGLINKLNELLSNCIVEIEKLILAHCAKPSVNNKP